MFTSALFRLVDSLCGQQSTRKRRRAAQRWGGALGEALETRIVLNSQVAIWFEQAVYEFDVPIGTQSGVPIGSVTASVSVPGTYVYFSGGTGPFQLNWDGVLTASSQVSGSVGEVITFTAWADTMEGPSAQSTVQITLTESVFAPVQFTQPLYQFTVPLGTPAHTLIGDVAITGGEYPWISGYHSLFAVNSTADPRSAQVMTTADVSGNVGDTISFQVTAGDMFTSASATVEITYTPGVDHLPEFLSHDNVAPSVISRDYYHFNLATLGTLSAFDVDYMDPLTFFADSYVVIHGDGDPAIGPNPFTVFPDDRIDILGPCVFTLGTTYEFWAYVTDEADVDLSNPDMSRTDSTLVVLKPDLFIRLLVDQPGAGGDRDTFEGSLWGDDRDSGHAWGEIRDNLGNKKTAGFFPENPRLLGPTNLSTPGIVKTDHGMFTVTASREWSVTHGQYVAVAKAIRTAQNAPPEYHLFNNNCATWAIDICSIVDGNIPKTTDLEWKQQHGGFDANGIIQPTPEQPSSWQFVFPGLSPGHLGEDLKLTPVII
jgi:hypothetical protein